jgi:hypothetical protein
MLKFFLACFAILVLWTGFDYSLHVWLLAPYYQANPDLWRPVQSMNVGLVMLVRVFLILGFVITYQALVSPKSIRTGFLFGLLIGLQLGVGVGIGTYIHSPIPFGLAMGWLSAAVVKSLIAGLVVGALLRPNNSLQRPALTGGH